MSPSPSMSAAKTDRAPSAVALMIWVAKFWLPSFSYHAIVSSLLEAESASISPSPSTSAAKTDLAVLAAALITRLENMPGPGDGDMNASR